MTGACPCGEIVVRSHNSEWNLGTSLWVLSILTTRKTACVVSCILRTGIWVVEFIWGKAELKIPKFCWKCRGNHLRRRKFWFYLSRTWCVVVFSIHRILKISLAELPSGLDCPLGSTPFLDWHPTLCFLQWLLGTTFFFFFLISMSNTCSCCKSQGPCWVTGS